MGVFVPLYGITRLYPKLADFVSEMVPKITLEQFRYEQTPLYKRNVDFMLTDY